MAVRCRAIALVGMLLILLGACGAPEPTATPVPPSPTTIPPTATRIPPTATLVPPAATPTLPPPTATAGISPGASAYLDEALDIMQEHAIHREQVDWEALRATTLQMAGDARTTASTYQAIRFALTELGDHHSYFMTPAEVAQFEDGTMNLASPDPRGELLEEGIGYLFLPGFAGMGQAANEQATRIQQIVAEVDSQAPCGWIVDLRENTGGSMWPMLAGIGPVLGEGRVGAFVSPDGQQVDWTYANGQARAGDALEAEVNGPAYELARPSPPVAVLTGPRTISSGEAIAVAFRGRPGTRSFGESTAGLSTANENYTLSDGAWILLTVSKFADRTGQVYGVSLTPDQMVRPQGSGTDPALQAAVDWLLQQPACTFRSGISSWPTHTLSLMPPASTSSLGLCLSRSRLNWIGQIRGRPWFNSVKNKGAKACPFITDQSLC